VWYCPGTFSSSVGIPAGSKSEAWKFPLARNQWHLPFPGTGVKSAVMSVCVSETFNGLGQLKDANVTAGG